MKKPIQATLIATLFSACMVGPDYVKPDGPTPGTWSEASGGKLAAEHADLATWWSVFGDPVLDSLMTRAVEANLDLKIAAARVREARAFAGRSRADLYPDVAAGGGYSRTRVSENGATPVVGDPESDLYSGGFDARWEIDVFGGTRRSIEAAEADLAATVEGRREVLVSLLGEVARSYVDLRGSQRRSAVTRRNIEAARSTLELTRTRLAAGMATELDVSRSQALLATTEAPLSQSEGDVRVEMHRLAVLLGTEPGALVAELEPEAPIPAAPDRILVGLPSELLERRPDVRRAERELAAATARKGVAVADRYPKFSLSGAFGLESANASDFADAASRVSSLGAAVRFPVFDGGRLKANVEIQDARMEQALLAYRQSMLFALEDVENAMVRYLREWDLRRSLETAAAADRRSVQLADDLYRKGLTDFLDVLDAERRLYESELALAQSEATASLSVVTLYKALGGGWRTEG